MEKLVPLSAVKKEIEALISMYNSLSQDTARYNKMYISNAKRDLIELLSRLDKIGEKG